MAGHGVSTHTHSYDSKHFDGVEKEQSWKFYVEKYIFIDLARSGRVWCWARGDLKALLSSPWTFSHQPSAPIPTLRRAGDNCARPECLNAKLIIERLDIHLSFLEIVRGKLLALVLQNVDSRLDIVSIKQYQKRRFLFISGAKRIHKFLTYLCMSFMEIDSKEKLDLEFKAC